jgi:hypothetical protein
MFVLDLDIEAKDASMFRGTLPLFGVDTTTGTIEPWLFLDRVADRAALRESRKVAANLLAPWGFELMPHILRFHCAACREEWEDAMAEAKRWLAETEGQDPIGISAYFSEDFDIIEAD